MKFRFILSGILVFSSLQNLRATDLIGRQAQQDSVEVSINYLNHLLSRQGNWYPQSSGLETQIRGLIQYIENDRVDSLVKRLDAYDLLGERYFFRTTENVADSLMVPGFMSHVQLQEELARIDRSVRDNIHKDQIAVPEQLLTNIEGKVKTLKEDESNQLLGTSYVTMPDSLSAFGALPDSLITSPADFKRLQSLDSTKRAILEEARQKYNNFVIKQYVDSVTEAYREEYIRQYSAREQKLFSDSVKQRNIALLRAYNEQVMMAVNDSVASSLRILRNFVDAEQLPLWLHNSASDSVEVFLSNSYPGQSRLFIKNEQDDSLGVRIQALNRNSLRFLIDDGVTFTRFSQRQKKDFAFNKIELPKALDKVDKRFKVITPWTLGGNFNTGLTQTYYNNWKSGGTSSFALLFVMKGFANYSSNKTKWENSLEIRNGWLKPSDDGVQKNDDKFEITTRYGIQAYKKWYYSAELDFETQFFNGFKYPDRETVISGFLSPAKTLIKLGLDYKPNKNFSLFLSPLTSKTVFVRDTARIDQTNFGIDEDKRRLWEGGLNADLSFKKELTPDISLQTKYKMFINYNAPFSKFDVDWENTFTFKLSTFINMQALFHLVYDDNVTFATNKVDADGNTIYKPKWQLKEFVTIGFTYSLNKPVYKRERLN
ncbi:Protein of unknown function (DUF3078) [Mangrovibacterium marinum]|uniref:DUF3078 domain-containing protein n=1 Tax=Mangrovibacterium marinum TaxID=1639118 RepID=A0A2T5C4P7_9BACT|nr:DUF3078 domain-containing protein [Mangrovibacterium marinum]PTN09830.1 Protein of unknown function (DUF3078) [Mangrovibacterium marinum]